MNFTFNLLIIKGIYMLRPLLAVARLQLTFKRRNVICFIQGISLYRAVNTFHHGYKNQLVNDVYSKSRCLL
jgi:hypothetical protein